MTDMEQFKRDLDALSRAALTPWPPADGGDRLSNIEHSLADMTPGQRKLWIDIQVAVAPLYNALRAEADEVDSLRQQLQGAVDQIEKLTRERDELATRLKRASANAETAEAEVARLTDQRGQ